MSDEAFKIYEEALKEQHTRNEARRIRTRVMEARGNRHSAGRRWPFELLQNALDSGPRVGKTCVKVCLRCDNSTMVLEHDGAPFTSSELAALLSGGSSKEFESETTSGRFGTGFLVTHVLAERTRLQGLLEVPTGCEQFDLVLDRGGSEDAILANIVSCNEAIRAARPLSNIDGVPSASFEYPIDDTDTLALGFEELRRALPYVYITRQSLGHVELQNEDGTIEVWTPGDVVCHPVEGGHVEQRLLCVQRNGTELPEMRIFRVTTQAGAAASALVLVENAQDTWSVRLPDPETPRVYREYPLRGSGFLPINLILDGRLDPDQERSRPLMSDKDRDILQEALAAALVAVRYACAEKWENAHMLARARKPAAAFDPSDSAEKQWWAEQLTEFAECLAALPIVECTTQTLPAMTQEGPYADFVSPRLLPSSVQDETTVERMWPLLAHTAELLPPRKELATDWTEIAEGWHTLGVKTNRVTVKELTDWVRGESDTLGQLAVEEIDPKQWLAHFLDIVGECWHHRTGIDLSVLAGMLPDQTEHLRSPADLSRDTGVSDKLKDICAAMGYDVRRQLLLTGLETIAEQVGLSYVRNTIETAIRTVVSEDDVIEQVIDYLDEKLPEDEDCDDRSDALQAGGARLLAFLWDSQRGRAATTARRVPLMTSRQRAVRWSQERMMMAPIQSWRESARPFAEAYPPHRVLADLYAGSPEQSIPSTVEALVDWGIAISDPISTDMPAELKERRLAAISDVDTSGVTVSRERFSQIALLQPEILNRCQEGIEEAKALLGLVLCHVAPNDPMWEQVRVVKGRKSGAEADVTVRGALWLADLRFRAWVPVPGEDERPAKMVANASTLNQLLNPEWLVGNDAGIRLLSDWFGFDQLELRLLGVAPDADMRRELRNSLAKLVEFGGSDPDTYGTLVDAIEAQRRRSRDVNRAKRLGDAVQEAVRSALESHDLRLDLIDREFDYEVTLPSEDLLEDVASRFRMGPYLLEVKATTTGRARLTPPQANRASKDASVYVLCVVDLRAIPDDHLDVHWTSSMVEPLAKMIPRIGSNVEQTCRLVETAKTCPVGIRNESALRYEVPLSLLDAGISISTWVESIKKGSP